MRGALAAAALAAAAAGCGGAATEGLERAPQRDVVAVASAPAEFFAVLALGQDAVERLGGRDNEGSHGTTWSPSDAELQSLVTAKRVLLMGAEFEPWAQRAGLPPSRTITLSEGLSDAALISTSTVTHTHGNGPAHSHGGRVPTVWTSPDLLRTLAHEAGERLAGVLAATPEAEKMRGDAAIERRRAFEAAVDAYGKSVDQLGEAAGGRTLIASDHGLEYLAEAAGAPLRVVLLNGENGRSDHAAGLLEQAVKTENHAGLLIWLGPVDQAFADAVKEDLGLESIELDLGTTGNGTTMLERLAASVRSLTQRLDS